MSGGHNDGQDILDETFPSTRDHQAIPVTEQPAHSQPDLERDVSDSVEEEVNGPHREGPPALSCLDPIADAEKLPVRTLSGNDDDDDAAITNVHTSTSTPNPSQPKEDNRALAPQVSIDAYGNTYPEGGLRAWLVVYGAFSGMTAGFGLMNTVGTFQAYLSTHQLASESPSTIGWIFSLYTFLAFFCGIQIGPFFDAKGPRLLVVAGTVCLIGGTFGVAESTGMSFYLWARKLVCGWTEAELSSLIHRILAFRLVVLSCRRVGHGSDLHTCRVLDRPLLPGQASDGYGVGDDGREHRGHSVPSHASAPLPPCGLQVGNEGAGVPVPVPAHGGQYPHPVPPATTVEG